MNKVARYRGTDNDQIFAKQAGYIYTNNNGMVIVDDAKKIKTIYDAKYIDQKLINSNQQRTDSNADILAIKSRLNVLQDKVSALKKTNTQVVAINDESNVMFEDETKDYILSGDIDKTTSVVAKSLELKNINVSIPKNASLTNGNAVFVNVTEDVEIKSGYIEMNQQTSSNCVKVQNAKNIIIRDTQFTGATYNTIMTGQNSNNFVKNMLIDNCNFNEDCKHINIWFAGHDDNAILTISNCHFKTSEQFLCISDFADSNNKLTVNIINCTIDNYDNSYQGNIYGYEYAGFMFIQSRNIGDYNTLVEKNPFGNGKLSINIENLIVKDVKITKDNFFVGNGQVNQSMYFYHKQSGVPGCIRYNEETKDLFPIITIK